MKKATLALACLALVAGASVAAPVVSSEFRYAEQVNEWFVRGDAAVSASPVFERGLRLAAWDERDPQVATRVAVATAVYFFQIPDAARSIRIEACYRAAPEATDKRLAGFIFVRNTAVERQYAEKYQLDATPAEEPAFYGHTYLLPADQVVMTLNVPTTDHVVNGVLEVHLSAGAGQVLDLSYVKATAFGETVPVKVEYAPSTLYVPNPYQYTYIYYYAGPWFYPRSTTFVSFWCFDDTVDPFWWNGWASFRACFFAYHPWIYRPVHYVHRPVIVFSPRVHVYRPAIIHHCRWWYERHFGLRVLNFGDPSLRLIVRRPRCHLPREVAERRHRHALVVADNIRHAGYDLRSRFGPSFRQRLDQWRRDPRDLRRYLQTMPRSAQIKRAALEWKTLTSAHKPKPPQPVSLPTPTRSPLPRTPKPQTRPTPSIIRSDPTPNPRPRIVIPTRPPEPERPSRPRPNIQSPPHATRSPSSVSPRRLWQPVRPQPPERKPRTTTPARVITFPTVRRPERPALPQPKPTTTKPPATRQSPPKPRIITIPTQRTAPGKPEPTVRGRTLIPVSREPQRVPTRRPPEPRRPAVFPPPHVRSQPFVGPRLPESGKPKPSSPSPKLPTRPSIPAPPRPTRTLPSTTRSLQRTAPSLPPTKRPTLRQPTGPSPKTTTDESSRTTGSSPRYSPPNRSYPKPRPSGRYTVPRPPSRPTRRSR